MELRDAFAIRIMAASIIAQTEPVRNWHALPHQAYYIADQMVLARTHSHESLP